MTGRQDLYKILKRRPRCPRGGTSAPRQNLSQMMSLSVDVFGRPVINKKIGEKIQINAIAHITGGGLIENLPRVIPNHLQANIELASWKQPPIFSWLQEKGNINSFEMHKTFNCGIGMVISVGQNDAEKAIDILNEKQANASLIGYLSERSTAEAIQLIE